MRNKNILLMLPLLLPLAAGGRAFAFTEGELLFTQNKARESIPLLEAEIADGRAGSDAYNYLGLAYFQIGDYRKSIEAFDDALKNPATNKASIQYNKGNSCYALKDYAGAAKCFTLCIEEDKSFSRAFLNRANTYLQMKRYIEAISDYTNFLKLDPKNPQRVNIIKLIGLLKEEQKRLDEEAAAQRQLTEEYSDKPDFYAPLAGDELFFDDPKFYGGNEELSEYYRDEYFGADKKSDDAEERLTSEQLRAVLEDERILEEHKASERTRQVRLSSEEQKSVREDESILERGRLLEEARLEKQRNEAEERRRSELEKTAEKLFRLESQQENSFGQEAGVEKPSGEGAD